MRRSSALRSLFVAVVALGSAACSTKRVLLIQSDPPGATVYVNGVARGTTPVEIPFVYYGDFDVRLEKQGYESLAGPVTVPTQLDGYPIIDLPQEWINRYKYFRWTGHMRALPAQTTEEDALKVYARGQAFRERTKREAVEGATPGRIPRGFPWDEPVPPPPPIPPLPRLP